MKKLHLLMVLIMALISTIITSCSNGAEPLPEPSQNDEGAVYEVKLSFDGEIPDFTESEEPISRADGSTPKRVYGINVWCMKTDGSETSYQNYAYGLFDNREDMIISLLGGYKYRFECYMVEDDIEELYISSTKLTGEYPFSQRQIRNKFVISSSPSYFYFDDTKITTVKSFSSENNKQSYNDESYQAHPKIGIFYGVLTAYIPSQNSIATIPIYKIGYYGLRIIVTGVPDGSLSVSPDYMETSTYVTGSTPYGLIHSTYSTPWKKTFTEAGSIENTFTGGFYSALTDSNWLNKMQNYTEKSSVSFTWTRANGFQQKFSKEVTLKRNVMTILTVNLTGGSSDVSLGFEEHTEDMNPENFSVDYDGGDMNDTPVNPEE